MKKRNLLLAFLMAFVMLITACGAKEEKTNPFLGKWMGVVDLTEYFKQSMVSENAELEKYAKFENLTLNYVFEFTEDTVSFSLDETSTQQFVSNVEAGVASMVNSMAADLAVENDVTAEDIFAGMGVTRDSYVQSVVGSMKVDEMVSAMATALELDGTYRADDAKITVVYEDNTFEEMKYVFEGDKLIITISDGTNTFSISCTKVE